MGKDSGSPPQAVDPYTQAGAQYGLSTGTALFNAGLNRTNQTNPLGSSTWSASYPSAPAAPNVPTPNAPTTGIYGLGGNINLGGLGSINLGNLHLPQTSAPQDPAGGAPTYTQNTSLTPWANQMLANPINTSGLPGMPGGPDISQNLRDTQNAIYSQQEGYLRPEQQLQSEQLQSQLANSGATIGSAAYNNEMDRLNREQTFQNQQAANAAITGGEQEQTNLFGLGTQGLQNQLAVRNAPISEYQALSGNGGAAAAAQTPDISGAFAQQLQSQLAGYNANVASNNATTSDVTSIAGLAAMYFL